MMAHRLIGPSFDARGRRNDLDAYLVLIGNAKAECERLGSESAQFTRDGKSVRVNVLTTGWLEREGEITYETMVFRNDELLMRHESASATAANEAHKRAVGMYLTREEPAPLTQPPPAPPPPANSNVVEMGARPKRGPTSIGDHDRRHRYQSRYPKEEICVSDKPQQLNRAGEPYKRGPYKNKGKPRPYQRATRPQQKIMRSNKPKGDTSARYTPAEQKLMRAMGARIAAERDRRKWTVVDLAAKTGVSTPTIKHIEETEGAPNMAYSIRIGKAFGWSLSQLWYGIDEPDSAPRSTSAAIVTRPPVHATAVMSQPVAAIPMAIAHIAEQNGWTFARARQAATLLGPILAHRPADAGPLKTEDVLNYFEAADKLINPRKKMGRPKSTAASEDEWTAAQVEVEIE